MGVGCKSGNERKKVGIGWFVDESGYTSIAIVCALLVSLSLVFAAASAVWVSSRSSEVQRVADAASLAAENVVASYATVAQVLDACTLSMGVTGMVVGGAGLILSAVPGLSGAGAAALKSAKTILDQRKHFADTSAKGLMRLERGLPFIIATHSASVVNANSHEGMSYTGVALPFPAQSQSELASAAELDIDEIEQTGEILGSESDKAKDAQDRARQALEDGWMADCGARPYCMWQRAQSLARLNSSENPYAGSASTWNFGMALKRGRAYYSVRKNSEAPLSQSIDEQVNSACRKAFYTYAEQKLKESSYIDKGAQGVTIHFERLFKTTDELHDTELYTQPIWPCSSKPQGATIHAFATCPGATGPKSGPVSLAELDAGACSRCSTCDFDTTDLGQVASASTSISNGFEHWWKKLCDAAERYEQARNELAESERSLSDLADKAQSAFDKAISVLGVQRPRLCPPGAYGCVAVVGRSSSYKFPNELTTAFLANKSLGPGAAISAAVLAPEDDSKHNNALVNLADALLKNGFGVQDSLSKRICELWSQALFAYGAGYGSVSESASHFFDLLEGVGAAPVANRLRSALAELVERVGLEPTDLRARKPVLVHTQDVLDKSSAHEIGQLRSFVEKLPTSGSPSELARALGRWVKSEYPDTTITVAELEIPGTPLKIPLTLDLGPLLEAP